MKPIKLFWWVEKEGEIGNSQKPKEKLPDLYLYYMCWQEEL